MSEVKVDVKKLKKAIKEINGLDLLETKIKLVKDKDKLIDGFCSAVEEIDTMEENDELSEEIVVLYDSIVEQLEEEEEPEEETEEEETEEEEEPEEEEEDEAEEEEEPEEEEDDLFAEMSRKELKAYIKEQDLDVKVLKKDTDKKIIKKIEAAEKKKAAAAKKADKKKPAKKADKKDKPKKKGTPIEKAKGPGVIGSIVEFIDKHGPISQDQILTRLKKRYKDRDPDKMMKTIKVQTGGKKHPIRIEREKKVKLKYDDKGKISIAKKNVKWKDKD